MPQRLRAVPGTGAPTARCGVASVCSRCVAISRTRKGSRSANLSCPGSSGAFGGR